MSRIVILTSGPLWRNPRVVKEATALGHAGHSVTVVNAVYFEQDKLNDRSIVQTAPFTTWPLDLSQGKSLVQRLRRLNARATRFAAKRMIWTGLFHESAMGPTSALSRRVRSLNWDLLIAHTELGIVIAGQLATKGLPVAADFEDWHSRDLLAEDNRNRPIGLIRRAEETLLNKALLVTTPSACMARELHRAYGGRLAVPIRNVFPLQPRPPIPRATPVPSFFWFSQTIGPGRGLEKFIEAWNLTRKHSRLVLLGKASPTYRKHLEAIVGAEKLGSFSILPTVHPNELPSVIARHDIGLALENFDPPSRNLTITNKLFQYLNAGLAVLATPTEGQMEAVKQYPEACLLIDLANPIHLSRQLDELLGSQEQLQSMAISARQYAETTCNWSFESARLVSVVDEALASRKS